MERPQFGGNVRYGLAQNLTLDGTYRPDFAEVEADAVQVQTDPRVAVFYPEKRPFFLDGIEQFATPVNTLIYTRQVAEPVAAAKLTGQLAGLNVAYLGADDDKSTSFAGSATPVYNLLRVERDVGSEGKLGVVATDRREARGSYNRVRRRRRASAVRRHLYTRHCRAPPAWPYRGARDRRRPDLARRAGAQRSYLSQ